MIMMNAEILKERMKPEVIRDNIGRDQWDYSNDKIIGTGNGWNYNVFNPDFARTKETGRFADQDDSLMRASGPAFPEGSGNKDNTVTIYQEQTNQENSASYADYADLEVLDKEFVLGKSLLLKAINNVTPEYLNSLKEHKDATDQEVHTARTLIKLVWHLNDSKDQAELKEWSEV